MTTKMKKAFKPVPAKVLAKVAGGGGLATPGVINWLAIGHTGDVDASSCRDANLFS